MSITLQKFTVDVQEGKNIAITGSNGEIAMLREDNALLQRLKAGVVEVRNEKGGIIKYMLVPAAFAGAAAGTWMSLSPEQQGEVLKVVDNIQRQAAQGITDAVKFAEAQVAQVRDALEQVGDAISEFRGHVEQYVRDLAEAGMNMVYSTTQQVLNFFTSIGDMIKETVGDALQYVGDIGRRLINSADAAMEESAVSYVQGLVSESKPVSWLSQFTSFNWDLGMYGAFAVAVAITGTVLYGVYRYMKGGEIDEPETETLYGGANDTLMMVFTSIASAANDLLAGIRSMVSKNALMFVAIGGVLAYAASRLLGAYLEYRFGENYMQQKWLEQIQKEGLFTEDKTFGGFVQQIGKDTGIAAMWNKIRESPSKLREYIPGLRVPDCTQYADNEGDCKKQRESERAEARRKIRDQPRHPNKYFNGRNSKQRTRLSTAHCDTRPANYCGGSYCEVREGSCRYKREYLSEQGREAGLWGGSDDNKGGIFY